jgi:hypothetical protein
MRARVLVGRLRGELPFERPWMAEYVDTVMTVDASATRGRLGWAPRERREMMHRLPFLLENFRADPVEWNRRNRAAMRHVGARPNLKIQWLLGQHAEEIAERYTQALTEQAKAGRFPSYGKVPAEEHAWNHRLILRQLMSSIRTRERSVFLGYCRDLAERRWRQGYAAEELCGALQELNRVCVEILEADPEVEDVRPYLYRHVSTTILFGCDRVRDTFERLESGEIKAAGRPPDRPPVPDESRAGSPAP